MLNILNNILFFFINVLTVLISFNILNEGGGELAESGFPNTKLRH